MADLTAITSNDTLLADLSEWNRLRNELAALKQKEMLLRKALWTRMFAEPVEGTNKFDLGDGFEVSGTHKIERKVDLASYQNLVEHLRHEGVPVDTLVKWKPELAISEYRKLNEDQAKKFDHILIISEGSPSMEIRPVTANRRGRK